MKRYLCIILFLFINFTSVYGAETRFSGEPIPRFVEITKAPYNTRVGPDVNYPVKYVYQSRHQPVRVVNEYYGWYQIEDINGDISWINRSATTNKTNYVMTLHDNTKLYQKKKLTSKIVAKVDKGTTFKVIKCSSGFCKVETTFNDTIFKGFLIQDNLWGI
ncbi:MAG: hypothetical protein IJ638_03470 [Alphaproteobacteria bacterium]|nr:hypothetical protein [Alphaproteobacteria bacterium]